MVPRALTESILAPRTKHAETELPRGAPTSICGFHAPFPVETAQDPLYPFSEHGCTFLTYAHTQSLPFILFPTSRISPAAFAEL